MELGQQEDLTWEQWLAGARRAIRSEVKPGGAPNP